MLLSKGYITTFVFLPISSDLPEESLPHCRRIQVACTNVISDMLQLYEDNTILQCKLNVQFKGEVGWTLEDPQGICLHLFGMLLMRSTLKGTL